jgi:hypothetical protein
VKTVAVELADGTRATYPVKDNGFARNVPARPVRVEWTAPGGEAEHMDFMHAPAFRAEDFYPQLKRPETPDDAFEGLPGARLIAHSGDTRAWLVPRLGAVCLVVKTGTAQASGCRHKAGDVRRPLIVATGDPRVLAIAFPGGASRVTLDGRPRSGDSLLVAGDGEHVLRYRDPAREPQTERLPSGAFTLHARPEPPTAIPPAG